MNRSIAQKLARLAIMIALAAAPVAFEETLMAPGIVSAQDTWIDVEEPRRTHTRPDGPGSLDEARTTGASFSLSGDRARDIPPTHTVHTGDTLWEITDHYYGNPWEWPRVWSYNPEITNPHWIYPLDQVRLLPTDGTVPQAAVGHVVARSRAQEDTVWLREQGWLDPEALRVAGEVIGSPTDHMLLSPYDEVYVHFDELEGDRDPVGEYTVFREIEATAREPGEQGTVVRILGTVRIESWDRDRRTARATLIEALEPIERGYRVAAVPRRFDVVAPVRADRDIETTVVASLAPRQLLSTDQIVFLPVGEADGVALGNRFYVVRAGDEWRRSVTAIGASTETMGTSARTPAEPEDWPDEVVAEGRVVSVRPHSVGLFITRSTRTVEVGDRAQLREGY